MKALITHSLCLAVAGLLLGCADSIYFYETQKVSITLEARPDGSQPVSGNVGIKQRVTVVTPPKKSGGQKGPEDDAVSMISKFDLRTKQEAGWDPIIIESTLLTGDAVAGLTATERRRAFGALAGLPPDDFTPAMATLGILFDSINSAGPDFGGDKEKETAFKEMKTNIIDSLNASSKRILIHFPKTFIKYSWNPRPKELSKEPAFGPAPADAPKFKALTFYRDGLRLSVESLRKLAKNFAQKDFTFKIQGVGPVSDKATKRELVDILKEQEKNLKGLDSEIRKEPAIRDAFQFYTDLFMGT